MPFHAQPVPSFWSEWLAGVLGLAALAAVLGSRRERLTLPSVTGVPALLLAVLVVQFALGRVAFPQLGLLHAAYLLWAALLAVAGRRLADEIGLERLSRGLALAFAAGAMLGALAAVAQWLGAADGLRWIFPRIGTAAYGNLGQANHHGHYSWLGIASLFYLAGSGRLSRRGLWALAVPMMLGSVLSGSRSVFLYPLVLTMAILWTRRRDPAGRAAALHIDAIALLPATLLLSWASGWISSLYSVPTLESGSRLYESVSGTSVRLALARTAWSAFLETPWLGQGAGNFSWASFRIAAGGGADVPYQVAEHAHNVVLQGLAEFGAPATLALVVLLFAWAGRFIAGPWRMEQAWCAAVLGIGAVHACLEYPQWYAYFLGPAALLLGATDSGRIATLAGRRFAAYLLAAVIAGVIILWNLGRDYAAIEAASNRPLAAHADRERAWRLSMDTLLGLHRDSLLSPWALLAFAELAEPSRQQAAQRITLCQRTIRFAPARSLLTRCAMQLAIGGREGDAIRLTTDVLRAFPAERTATLAELARGAATFPEIRPLVDAGRNPGPAAGTG